jgi:hypothetical protein
MFSGFFALQGMFFACFLKSLKGKKWPYDDWQLECFWSHLPSWLPFLTPLSVFPSPLPYLFTISRLTVYSVQLIQILLLISLAWILVTFDLFLCRPLYLAQSRDMFLFILYDRSMLHNSVLHNALQSLYYTTPLYYTTWCCTVLLYTVLYGTEKLTSWHHP